MKRISGRYPGGPSRGSDSAVESPPRDKVVLPSVAQIEARMAVANQRVRLEARRRRVVKGVVLSVVVAGAIGLWLGFESHRTEEELAQEERREAAPEGVDLNMQADRVINEIWKTEALEKIPNRR